MGEPPETPRVAAAGGRDGVVHQPAQLGSMLVDAAVNRGTGQDLEIDAGAVDIGKPPGVVPRRQSRTCPRGEQSLLFIVSQFNQVGVEVFRRAKKSAGEGMTMEINFHLGNQFSSEEYVRG
jgi:hypothetical protein